MKLTKSGFTIVELLVVIVVISILASVTVVAFNGMQQRAQAIQATAIAEGYIKLIKMYKSEHGYYPSNSVSTAPPNSGLGCLGNVSDFPAMGNYLAGECSINTNSSNGWAWRGLANTTLMDALAPYGNVRQPSYPSITASSGTYREEWRGIRYDPAPQINPTSVFVQWSVKGNQLKNCGPGTSDGYNTSYDATMNLTLCSVYLR